jgi:hypothetical protein
LAFQQQIITKQYLSPILYTPPHHAISRASQKLPDQTKVAQGGAFWSLEKFWRLEKEEVDVMGWVLLALDKLGQHGCEHRGSYVTGHLALMSGSKPMGLSLYLKHDRWAACARVCAQHQNSLVDDDQCIGMR